MTKRFDLIALGLLAIFCTDCQSSGSKNLLDGFLQMADELGTDPTPAAYWTAYEEGAFPDETVYKPNSLFQVLKSGLLAQPPQ